MSGSRERASRRGGSTAAQRHTQIDSCCSPLCLFCATCAALASQQRPPPLRTPWFRLEQRRAASAASAATRARRHHRAARADREEKIHLRWRARREGDTSAATCTLPLLGHVMSLTREPHATLRRANRCPARAFPPKALPCSFARAHLVLLALLPRGLAHAEGQPLKNLRRGRRSRAGGHGCGLGAAGARLRGHGPRACLATGRVTRPCTPDALQRRRAFLPPSERAGGRWSETATGNKQ